MNVPEIALAISTSTLFLSYISGLALCFVVMKNSRYIITDKFLESAGSSSHLWLNKSAGIRNIAKIIFDPFFINIFGRLILLPSLFRSLATSVLSTTVAITLLSSLLMFRTNSSSDLPVAFIESNFDQPISAIAISDFMIEGLLVWETPIIFYIFYLLLNYILIAIYFNFFLRRNLRAWHILVAAPLYPALVFLFFLLISPVIAVIYGTSPELHRNSMVILIFTLEPQIITRVLFTQALGMIFFDSAESLCSSYTQCLRFPDDFFGFFVLWSAAIYISSYILFLVCASTANGSIIEKLITILSDRALRFHSYLSKYNYPENPHTYLSLIIILAWTSVFLIYASTISLFSLL